MKYVPAKFNEKGFTCPYDDCAAYSKQEWKTAHVRLVIPGYAVNYPQVAQLMLAVCDHCGKFSLWLNGAMVHPAIMSAPQPHSDMPDELKADYEEARGVFGKSLRSSAALLRLAIQKICIKLGLPGENLHADIGKLVEKGMPIRIQQSLDIVRVVGNEQVHPGVLDVRDDPAMAMTSFELVNLIVEDRIANPKRVAEVYAKLPPEKREQIERRDGPKVSS